MKEGQKGEKGNRGSVAAGKLKSQAPCIPRLEARSSALKCGVLATGPPGDSHLHFLTSLLYPVEKAPPHSDLKCLSLARESELPTILCIQAFLTQLQTLLPAAGFLPLP